MVGYESAEYVFREKTVLPSESKRPLMNSSIWKVEFRHQVLNKSFGLEMDSIS